MGSEAIDGRAWLRFCVSGVTPLYLSTCSHSFSCGDPGAEPAWGEGGRDETREEIPEGQ